MANDTIQIKGISSPVSRVALGTWAIGGWMWGGPDDDNSIRTIHRALEEGVNFIDTAPVYGFGHSEEVVGKALEGKRDQVVIATKLGLNWKDESPFRDSRPERIRQEVEDSLRRLKTDYIDLYQVHWPDEKTPIEETADTLNQLVKEGKVRALGVSNYSIEQMDRFKAHAPLSTVQPPYNLFERDIEAEILPYMERNGLVGLGYGALCRGLLAGKMNADSHFPDSDLRSNDPKFQSPRFEQYLKAVDDLRPIADRHGKSVLQLAIRWVLDQGPMVALWGARKPGQIEGIKGVFGWSLSDQDKQEINELLTRDIKEPVGPEFMAPPNR
ncbi:Aldo-keto reductase YhdN [Halomonadaceae bacterium LMG 33818]|uniref:aldo/keto reductase n=1 Tax=Cernens ardua TaxID=3402176 RepID=UPI003EDBE15E